MRPKSLPKATTPSWNPPNAEPPRVRPPPYTHAPVDCREDEDRTPHVSPNNLCGDLNKGVIPRNPMGQNVLGSPYPFELIRNMTLKFLSRTLPILKADETLPKVAQLQDDLVSQNTISPGNNNDRHDRVKRETNSTEEPSNSIQSNPLNSTITESSRRQARKFCDQGGVFCMLYKAINGEPLTPSTAASSSHLPLERRDEAAANQPRYEGPPTPCPAKVEYATPVFAKNYQGIWRYVVQIPYEGYFTQTVEVTSSDTANPQRSPVAASQPPSVQDFQNYQQYLHKRAGLPSASDSATTQKPMQCDGVDALGCFQVRLYYDWFLIPGSCKCWRPDYFNKYVRRKSTL
ncbi:hypothetical protein NQ315_007117 [Exocentrus adspersus]|uniref:Spaetzle domain-containing protein n=1 Tax=Exocentrus adspersus TaxID=1586481 RepID=A0AAV8WCJ9_9CUCU|nr:hypothetical protein NQ315_007117 [Exocentrus adspersus]